ncbi:two-component system VirA-like sensor kinase [Rhizobium sp. WYJ-E13]|uniref:two-component system VirA-like sensor kinase n=1 Tax=Rhizobium sp. WYJ-E13 TaxID=2849093 RepID=UPI001C1F1914|nr:two-component system VirA-like sensor kinase [Rhizobium sp. WYJ-E13]QWW72296.1 two-component system VirA-like sensor kinase [Rhizobium sp. WYJ-E13]
MDERSKRPRQSAIELWRILLLLATAFSLAALAIGRVPSRENHEAILTNLRAIDINHASLQRDVLQARAGLLRNYDPLVKSIVDLHRTIDDLRPLFVDSGVETSSALDAELSTLAASVDMDEQLVERFKTENALLQNSLSLANQMLSDLNESNDPVVVQSLASSGDLGNLMMRFSAEPEPQIAALIRSKLASLVRADATRDPDVSTFVAHASLILTMLPSVDATIESIQASRTSSEAQLLQTKYLDAYGIISNRSAWSRMFLASLSVILCLYIAVLIYRLRAQTFRLTQQLDFENLAAAIKKRFADDNASAHSTMVDVLAMVARFFDASQFAFAVLDMETKEVQEQYGQSDEATISLLIDRFFETQSSVSFGESGQWERFYRNLQQSEIQAFPESALSAGSVAAARIDTNHAGLILLEHAQARIKPSNDEVRLLANTIDVITQGLRAQQEQKEKEALEARLEHAQRLEAVGTLAGGIAHEFNNTLGAIMGYGELALQQSRNPSRTRQYVREILSSGQRAKHVIDQILTLSRKRERISRPFDVREAIDDILPLVRLSVPGDIGVSATIVDGLPAVFGNPIELQQVIMNLSMNAAQASRKSDPVEITVDRVETAEELVLSHGELPPGRYVRVSVVDSGSGIAPNVLPHIFEPFFTTRAKVGGTGLGLAAVHGYVTGMSGMIDVESEPGRGTSFRVYLPTTCYAPVPLAEFFNERSVPIGHGQLVVIGQQDAKLRPMYEEKIAALGYEPVGVSDLVALEKWLDGNGRSPDLLVLDLDLWPTSPDLHAIADKFRPLNILFLTNPTRDLIDARAFQDLSLLRLPVSSNNLAIGLSKAMANVSIAARKARTASL